MKTVSNQELTIRVSEHGAELSSIVANATGKEYLWQADPAFWKRHSPVLFPIVGSVWKAEYRNEGTVYPLSQHGFARDMDFTLIDEAENELRFALESTPDTLRAYPFPFLLEIGYRLEGNKVEVLWRVKNTGDKTMHFQIGAHPAFLYPNYEVDQPDRGYFAFDVKKDLVYRALVEKGCVGDVVYDLLRDEYDIQAEFGDLGNILAYLSIGDRQREVERLVSALAEIKRRFSRDKSTLMDFDYIDPIVAMSPQEAFYGEKESLPIRETAGRVCSEFVMCYPPGIPILTPGEQITEEIIDYIAYALEKGCSMTGPEDPGIERLNVLK